MRVTAIMPVLNGAGVIERALTSLKAQTHPLYEIIVADDNSTDESFAIALRSGAQVTTHYSGGDHWGISGGRNEALRMATGDAILPLDADDWVDPTYVEKTVAKLKDGVGIVSTYMRYEHDGFRNGEIVPAYRCTYDQELHWNGITVCSLVLKEALDKAGPYDTLLKGWEDWDMWLRILKLGYRHDIVPEVLFNYHLSDTGMNSWANKNKEFLTNYLRSKHPGFKGGFNGLCSVPR